MEWQIKVPILKKGTPTLLLLKNVSDKNNYIKGWWRQTNCLSQNPSKQKNSVIIQCEFCTEAEGKKYFLIFPYNKFLYQGQKSCRKK